MEEHLTLTALELVMLREEEEARMDQINLLLRQQQEARAMVVVMVALLGIIVGEEQLARVVTQEMVERVPIQVLLFQQPQAAAVVVEDISQIR